MNHSHQETPLEKLEHFFVENKKSLTVIGGAIGALTLLILWYLLMYSPAREIEAQNQMFHAENYFLDGSYTEAIDGDGSYPGFQKIVDEYGNTKAGNLAQYYLGISYLRVGRFEEAVEHLTSFSSSDLLVSTIALGATGDAYSELKNYDKAVVFYKKAAEKNKNALTSAIYLKKLGLVCEQLKDYEGALEAYKTLQNEYGKSLEARNIEAYIGRVEASQL